MSSTKKPSPSHALPPRRRCPVCGQNSYSAAGIHPQCAVRQADAKRLKSTKPVPPPKKLAPVADRQPWQKDCPKCHVLVHVRKKMCTCGFVFREAAVNVAR